MKIVFRLFLGSLLSTSAFAQLIVYTEAGVSYAALQGADYSSGIQASLATGSMVPGAPVPKSTNTIFAEDKSSWASDLAAGYAFSDRIGVRLDNPHLGKLPASAKATIIIVGDAALGDLSFRFNDTVHVLSLAPEINWPLTGKFMLTMSRELNWVASRGEVLVSTTSTSLTVVPWRERNEQEFSLGALAGVRYAFTERCDLNLGYKYSDLKPSWSREAHMISGGLKVNF